MGGDCTPDNNVETLDAVGVECGAMLEVVIAREAIDQKVAGIYAATEVAQMERREEEWRLGEERQREERRLREKREREERERRERERAMYRHHWQIFKTNFQASPQYVAYLEKKKKRREEARRKAEMVEEMRRINERVWPWIYCD